MVINNLSLKYYKIQKIPRHILNTKNTKIIKGTLNYQKYTKYQEY